MDIDTQANRTDGRTDASQFSLDPPWFAKVFYRVRQFFQGITAHVDADEMLVATEILSKPALAQFCQMALDNQRHSLNVLYTLQEAGWDEPDLGAAALLHDVGKNASTEAGIQLSPWLRTSLVLLHALIPEQFEALAKNDVDAGWRYLLHVHLTHPQIGSQRAAEADCSELTCWLIEHHQDALSPPFLAQRERLLAALQWADNRN